MRINRRHQTFIAAPINTSPQEEELIGREVAKHDHVETRINAIECFMCFEGLIGNMKTNVISKRLANHQIAVNCVILRVFEAHVLIFNSVKKMSAGILHSNNRLAIHRSSLWNSWVEFPVTMALLCAFSSNSQLLPSKPRMVESIHLTPNPPNAWPSCKKHQLI